MYKVYTDGAVSNNGQAGARGGWAFIVVDETDDLIFTNSGYEKNTTNQRMELTAVNEAIKYMINNFDLKQSDFSQFTIYTDSAYIVNCVEQGWWERWIENGWRNAKKEAVKNKDLWSIFISYLYGWEFEIQKVKGHSGDKWNEIVDQLAVSARSEII